MAFAVAVRPGVGRVDNDGVVGNAEFVQHIEYLTDVAVMVDHRVAVGRLPQSRLADALRLGVGEHMHVGEVAPDEERRARGVLALDVVDSGVRDLIVDGLDALLVQRTGVLDGLLTDRAVLRASVSVETSSVASHFSTPRGRASSYSIGNWSLCG